MFHPKLVLLTFQIQRWPHLKWFSIITFWAIFIHSAIPVMMIDMRETVQFFTTTCNPSENCWDAWDAQIGPHVTFRCLVSRRERNFVRSNFLECNCFAICLWFVVAYTVGLLSSKGRVGILATVCFSPNRKLLGWEICEIKIYIT